MAQRMLIFDPHSLVRLMTHYSEGAIPLNSELKGAGVGQILGREIGLWIEAPDWDGPIDPTTGLHYPFYFGYEGRRTMKWSGSPHDEVEWSEEGYAEAPKQT